MLVSGDPTLLLLLPLAMVSHVPLTKDKLEREKVLRLKVDLLHFGLPTTGSRFEMSVRLCNHLRSIKFTAIWLGLTCLPPAANPCTYIFVAARSNL